MVPAAMSAGGEGVGFYDGLRRVARDDSDAVLVARFVAIGFVRRHIGAAVDVDVKPAGAGEAVHAVPADPHVARTASNVDAADHADTDDRHHAGPDAGGQEDTEDDAVAECPCHRGNSD